MNLFLSIWSQIIISQKFLLSSGTIENLQKVNQGSAAIPPILLSVYFLNQVCLNFWYSCFGIMQIARLIDWHVRVLFIYMQKKYAIGTKILSTHMLIGIRYNRLGSKKFLKIPSIRFLQITPITSSCLHFHFKYLYLKIVAFLW